MSKQTPQNKPGPARARVGPNVIPDRRAGTPAPLNRPTPTTTVSARGSGGRGRIDNKRGPGAAPPGGGPARGPALGDAGDTGVGTIGGIGGLG